MGSVDRRAKSLASGIAAGNREHALGQQLAQGVIDLACLPLVAQTSCQSLDQSIAAVSSLQQDGSAVGTAIHLIEPQFVAQQASSGLNNDRFKGRPEGGGKLLILEVKKGTISMTFGGQ